MTTTANQTETSELRLWEQIKEDWNAHRDWTKPGCKGRSSSKVRRLEDASRTKIAAGAAEHSVSIDLQQNPQYLRDRLALQSKARPPLSCGTLRGYDRSRILRSWRRLHRPRRNLGQLRSRPRPRSAEIGRSNQRLSNRSEERRVGKEC